MMLSSSLLARFPLRAINRLGELALAQDQLDEAHTRFRGAFETTREALGEEHLETLQARISLGTVLARMQRFEEAERLLLEATQRPVERNTVKHAVTKLVRMRDIMGIPSQSGESWG